MPRPWLKVCGLTRAQDARLALAAGASYVGCLLEIPRSPRSLSLAAAAPLAEAAPGALVAVVENPSAAFLQTLASALHPAAVQLHGQESPQQVARLRAEFPGLVLWKALGLPAQEAGGHAGQATLETLTTLAREYAEAGAAALLLDAQVGGRSGGTGRRCDWSLAAALAGAASLPVILAGGLNPENLEEAARQVRPAGLDVSSGVEEAPGVKSEALLAWLGEAWRRL